MEIHGEVGIVPRLGGWEQLRALLGHCRHWDLGAGSIPQAPVIPGIWGKITNFPTSESLWVTLMAGASNSALNLHNPGVSPRFLGAAALGKAAPAPHQSLAAPQRVPAAVEDSVGLDICRFFIFHPSFPWSLLFLTTLSPQNHPRAKQQQQEAGFSQSSDARFSWRQDFFLSQSQKNRAGSGRRAKVSKHIFPPEEPL